MSLSDEFEAEAALVPPSQRSQIDVFLETLTEDQRADVDAWVASGKNRRAMFVVLKGHGLPVAESTFRNWAATQCR